MLRNGTDPLVINRPSGGHATGRGLDQRDFVARPAVLGIALRLSLPDVQGSLLRRRVSVVFVDRPESRCVLRAGARHA